MDLFVCANCVHTTLDHEMGAPRPCLVCECKTMKDGEPFVKVKNEKPLGDKLHKIRHE